MASEAGKHNTKGAQEKMEQRRLIWEMYEQGVPVTEIARRMKCAPSSISANLRRQKEKRLRVADYTRITMRDQFAMAALTGIISSGVQSTPGGKVDAAYTYADIMMEARNAKD